MIKTLEAQAGVYSGLQVPIEPVQCRARAPAEYFLHNVQLHQQRSVILRVDSLALWKVINVQDAVLIQKIEARTFPAYFCTRNFLGLGELLCRHSIDCCYVSGSYCRDINRFRPWSPIATGNHLDRTEKIPHVAQTTGTVEVFDTRSGISGPTSRRASACPNLHE